MAMTFADFLPTAVEIGYASVTSAIGPSTAYTVATCDRVVSLLKTINQTDAGVYLVMDEIMFDYVPPRSMAVTDFATNRNQIPVRYLASTLGLYVESTPTYGKLFFQLLFGGPPAKP